MVFGHTGLRTTFSTSEMPTLYSLNKCARLSYFLHILHKSFHFPVMNLKRKQRFLIFFITCHLLEKARSIKINFYATLLLLEKIGFRKCIPSRQVRLNPHRSIALLSKISILEMVFDFSPALYVLFLSKLELAVQQINNPLQRSSLIFKMCLQST
jgi:hypothetical protein